MNAPNKSTIPLGRYRLARTALDLRSFTAAELATMAQVPTNTAYGFLSELEGCVVKEALAVNTPGRPRVLYTLTGAGIEQLLSENFEITKAIREAGLESAGPAARSRAAAARVEERQPSEPVEKVHAVARETANTTREGRRSGMQLMSLRRLYIDELKDLHNADRQIIQALPRMAKRASNEKLRAAFWEHLEVTRQQLARLDQIFERLGKRAAGKKCKGVEVLIEEAKEMMQEEMDPEALDATLIATAQRVEHYKMAGYGTVRTYAELLGEEEAVKLLQRSLDEEGDADKKLTQLIKDEINVAAGLGVPAGTA